MPSKEVNKILDDYKAREERQKAIENPPVKMKTPSAPSLKPKKKVQGLPKDGFVKGLFNDNKMSKPEQRMRKPKYRAKPKK